MASPPLQEAREKLRAHKARLALYEFLHAAMWEGEDCPPPKIIRAFYGCDYDQYITERLHFLLGIRKPWWKQLFGR